MLTSGSPESPPDGEHLKKKEDEHLRLMRQVRIIQTDRSHAVEGVHPLFRREDRLLRTLKKEYSNLKKDLKIATAGAQKKKGRRVKKDLKASILDLNYTETKQEDGLTVIDQLDGVLQRNNKHILNLRSLASARIDKIVERKSQSEQRLVSTENKLENAILRFNQVQHENKKIREEIEHMLKDRALFNQSWHKILGILKTGKKFLSDLFESSTLAYDQRDEWCAKLRNMQEKGIMDQTMQVQEMRSLQKAYDHDMKLYNFLAIKGVTRVNQKAEQRELQKKNEKENQLRNEFNKHCKILDDIQHYTNELNIDKIKTNFRRREQENLSIYELLTCYCAENVVLEKEVKCIRRDIADRRDFNTQRDNHQHDTLMTLQQQLTEVVSKNNRLKEKLGDQGRQLEYFMQKIGELFKMLGCSLEPFQNLLGDKQPTLRQLELTLELITMKIKELIELVYFCERRGTPKLRGKSPDTSQRSQLKKYMVHTDMVIACTTCELKTKMPTDPCPACMESWWMFRVTDNKEQVLNKEDTLTTLENLKSDLTFDMSERIHPITDCKSPQSRLILAKRYMP